MSSPKPGDRVRVTFEGKVDATFAGFPHTVTLDGGTRWGIPGEATVEVLAPALPPEPPVGSVVLDDLGRAWQRRKSFRDTSRWKATHHRLGEASWESLKSVAGPLRVLYDPESMREEDRERD